MGNCVRKQKVDKKKGGKGSAPVAKQQEDEQYLWEQEFLSDKLCKTGTVTKAAIVATPSGELRAWHPSTFVPEQPGIDDIVKALVKSKTGGLAEHGIVLGNGVPVCTPGKIEDGVIYGSDGLGGGCVIARTRANIVIAVYDQNPAGAAQLVTDCTEYMQSTGR